MLDRWLKQRTGWGSRVWMHSIQETVKSYWPGHVEYDPKASWRMWKSGYWIGEVAKRAWDKASQLPDYILADHNIQVGMAASVIMVLWVCRVLTAKSKDPRRDNTFRKHARNLLRSYRIALMEAITDDSCDPVYFPDQKWPEEESVTVVEGKE